MTLIMRHNLCARRRLALINAAFLVIAIRAVYCARSSPNELETSTPSASQQDVAPIRPGDVWIDAFDMETCGRARFRPWQEQQSAFGCAGAGDSHDPDTSEHGDAVAPRILGGELAQEGEFPFFVHMNHTWGDFWCGATLIHENLVVTAAHCVEEPGTEGERRLIFGTDFINGTGGELRDIDRWCFPLKYDNPNPPHDLAIVRFRQNIKYTSKIWPACLNLDSLPSNETICAIAGLGRIRNEEMTLSNRLKVLRVKRSCRERFEDQSCYMTPGGISDGLQVSHKADSGAPVVCYDRCALDSSARVQAFAVGSGSWSFKGPGAEPEPTLELLGNHAADFYKQRHNLLAMLQAIRREGNETTDRVKCVVPNWVKPLRPPIATDG